MECVLHVQNKNSDIFITIIISTVLSLPSIKNKTRHVVIAKFV